MASSKEWMFIIAILCLFGVVAVPKYVEHSAKQHTIEKENAATRVKSALVLALADVKTFPSINVLASYVQADQVIVTNSGLSVLAAGHVFFVRTYKDRSCTLLTETANDTVKCVV